MKRLLAILFIVVIGQNLSAQTDSNFVQANEKLGYIFTLGVNRLARTDQLTGFTFGVGTEYFLVEKVSIRPAVYLSFLSQRLSNDFYMETSVLEIPLHAVVRPFAWKWSPYFAGGTSCKIDVSNFSSRWFADTGFGVERDLGYSALAPEIRCSFGKEMTVVYGVLNFKF